MQNFIKIYMKIALSSRFHLDNIGDTVISLCLKINIWPFFSPGLNQQWHVRHTSLNLGRQFS